MRLLRGAAGDLLGLALIVAGVAAWSWPAALIVAGVGSILLNAALELQ